VERYVASSAAPSSAKESQTNLQDEIAKAIAERLRVTLDALKGDRLVEQAPPNVEAYQVLENAQNPKALPDGSLLCFRLNAPRQYQMSRFCCSSRARGSGTFRSSRTRFGVCVEAVPQAPLLSWLLLLVALSRRRRLPPPVLMGVFRHLVIITRPSSQPMGPGLTACAAMGASGTVGKRSAAKEKGCPLSSSARFGLLHWGRWLPRVVVGGPR